MKHVSVLVAGPVAIAAFVTPAALAAPPTAFREDFNVTFVDPLFAEVCGIAVTSTIRGHVVVRSHDSKAASGLTFLVTYNLAFTYSSNGEAVTLQANGAQVSIVAPDGTVTNMQTGQLPNGDIRNLETAPFIGVQKINGMTGEVILEPQHILESHTLTVCRELAG